MQQFRLPVLGYVLEFYSNNSIKMYRFWAMGMRQSYAVTDGSSGGYRGCPGCPDTRPFD